MYVVKVISLNTWGGRAGLSELLTFFKKHEDTDIFCLQEIWNGGEHMLTEVSGGVKLEGAVPQLLKAIQKGLPEHHYYFRPHFFDFYGLALFIKKDLDVFEEGEFFVYKERGYFKQTEIADHGRNIQYVKVKTSHDPYTLVNFHGLWNGNGKGDSEDRLLQSDNILKFIQNLSDPFVLVGDFNLQPDTKSLKKLEAAGMRNLIKEYGITSTRTRHYTKKNRFADYVLVSDGIEVLDFKVLPDEVSDHSPLYLEFK